MAYTTIDDPEKFFQVITWAGNGQARALTFDGTSDMQPDIVMIKPRAATAHGTFTDAVRGVTKAMIYSNSTAGESTVSGGVTAFGSDGFSVGTTGEYNYNGDNFMAYCWNCNGSGSSNTDGGTNTSATSANQTSGTSISKWAGSSSDEVQTVGHGLGAVPEWVLTKNTGSGSSITAWVNYHVGMGNTHTVYLNNNDAKSDNAVHGDTTPTSSVFSFNTGSDDDNYVSYSFAPKQGFSKFGTYEGNGNADGTYVHLGFQPAFLIVKPIDSADNWVAFNHKVHLAPNASTSPYFTYLNATGSETTDTKQLELLSSGFKIRASGNTVNRTSTFIYMAWAIAPFVNSNGVPGNAR
jgi:hypothetical protein|tara:strand:+ start:56 stop:1108 length:1053 start_codon:yes stop_codon:yes gene_type:complete